MVVNVIGRLTLVAKLDAGPGEFPAQRPVTRSFELFFDLSLNKQLSKQSWGSWLETNRAHHDVIVM